MPSLNIICVFSDNFLQNPDCAFEIAFLVKVNAVFAVVLGVDRKTEYQQKNVAENKRKN
jgi:hypothetical protein